MIRIPDDSRRKRWKQILLVAVLLAAAGGLIFYQIRASDYTRIVPKSRTLSAFEVTWRCLACQGEFRDKGSRGPQRCRKCGKDQAYVSFVWNCPTHGSQKVAVQYDESKDPSPTQAKVEGKDWTAYFTSEGGYNIRCPVCDAKMTAPMSY